MTTDTIDGEATEVEEPRALTVVPVAPVGLSRATEPDELIAMASKWAKALKDVVERQHLFAVIQGKKYPQVEAWMTVGRMDNVVAREADHPIRHDDGSYEAFVELIRLSDGAIVGRASALCGTPDDKPWATRSEPSRRSMAVTRATSRAFRQQYSWIMVLAGYEPTPADEMPRDERSVDQETGEIRERPTVVQSQTPRTEPWLSDANIRMAGKVTTGKPPADGNRRISPDDMPFMVFALHGEDGKTIPQCVAEGPLCDDLFDATEGGAKLAGLKVTVEGDVWRIPWTKDGRNMPAFQRLILTRISTNEWSLPTPKEAESLPLDLA